MKPSHFDDVYLNEKKGIEISTSFFTGNVNVNLKF